MQVVREFYDAINRADLDAIAARYDPGCVVEQGFTGDAAAYAGRDDVRARWAAELDRFAGALAGGHRVHVSRVAGIQTGWGWVQSEWVSAVTSRAGSDGPIDRAGYTYFWIEDGLIRRQRSIEHEGTRVESAPAPADAAPILSRPARARRRPTVGVGAVVFDDSGRVVLVKRRHEPLAEQWSLPGGTLEWGETLEAGTAREILEETSLVVDVGPVVEVFDRILLDNGGQVKFHFVLVDYLCSIRAGTLTAGSDVSDVQLVPPRDVAGWRVAGKVRDVIDKAVRLSQGAR